MDADLIHQAPGALPPIDEKKAAGVAKILEESSKAIANENVEKALGLLRSYLEVQDHPDVWLKLAKAYRITGDELIARSMMRNVILRLNRPHIMDIITAKIPYTKLLVLENLKLVYVNIPKCGSSSVKDAILVASNKQRRLEASHFHVQEFEKIVPFQDLDGKYKNYTKIAITRHPLDRLRSYFRKNVREAQSLVREAQGKNTYYGLNTNPEYAEIVSNFQDYRRIFDDFRHHTDSMVGYLGLSKSRYTSLFDVSKTKEAIGLLKNLTGEDIPDIHNMRSEQSALPITKEDENLEKQLVDSFYKRELNVYFSGSL
ncbi:sulfotransferase family 2 domain-containing protein [Acidisoma cellulosilytica]|uniref:Sulfotransferase family 2 domain-containing protein n=1 Tax=Acidisoma cellulosilyticum TaxID=2802395 RepID=A0A964E703_9PROT|nr:sulfotransferase family 2 domain-containing protein [Acidisoma cellulosilyticum]MCB8884129.1 sulfotransferase family 2 domain-containing protein [Acidisoma cellulosilyticum]